jgi:hypothetical protein
VLESVDLLSDDELRELKSGGLDGPVGKLCSAVFNEFLRQSGLTSLSAL